MDTDHHIRLALFGAGDRPAAADKEAYAVFLSVSVRRVSIHFQQGEYLRGEDRPRALLGLPELPDRLPYLVSEQGISRQGRNPHVLHEVRCLCGQVPEACRRLAYQRHAAGSETGARTADVFVRGLAMAIMFGGSIIAGSLATMLHFFI
jgi:hypothetical protein